MSSNDENVEVEASTCSICGMEYTGMGNNAEPINRGRCCDDCNDRFVIKARSMIYWEVRERETNARAIKAVRDVERFQKIQCHDSFPFVEEE